MSKFIKSALIGALACSASFASITSSAADITVEITNLTRGSYFTPLLVAAHPEGSRLFTSGTASSASLQAMAEGGDISGLVADLATLNATVATNPAGGLLAPGASTDTTINTDATPGNTQLSVVSMVLPSNDGFIGLNAVTIPTEPGVYRFNVNAYDSGTEANDEVVGSGVPGEAGYPAPGPVLTSSGTGGTGVNATVEGFVHIHRGVLGDTDATGGNSDIDATQHRWLNPIARVVITVN